MPHAIRGGSPRRPAGLGWSLSLSLSLSLFIYLSMYLSIYIYIYILYDICTYYTTCLMRLVLMRPHLLNACFVVSRFNIICHTIRHFWRNRGWNAGNQAFCSSGTTNDNYVFRLAGLGEHNAGSWLSLSHSSRPKISRAQPIRPGRGHTLLYGHTKNCQTDMRIPTP